MLISKKVWCFACPDGELIRSIEKHGVFTYAVDTCQTCRATKRTIMLVEDRFDHYVKSPGDVCGATHYEKDR